MKKAINFLFFLLLILIVLDTLITLNALSTTNHIKEINPTTLFFVGYFGNLTGVLVSGIVKLLLVIFIYLFYGNIFSYLFRVRKDKDIRNSIDISLLIILFIGFITTLDIVIKNLSLIQR